MTVNINDVLSHLPEWFPGDQDIPLANLRFNPYNPGPPFTQEQIDKKAEDLAENGQLNAITVRPDPENPLAPGVELHPTDYRLRGDGQPWKISDFIFQILGGALRTRGGEKLNWQTMKGKIKLMSDEEAAVFNYKDNDVADKGWFGGYQAIENLIRANPNITFRRIKERLGFDRERIGWALRLLPLLNPEARGLIGRIPANSNLGKKGFSESAAFELTGLGPGIVLKRGVKKKTASTRSSIDPVHANHGPQPEAGVQQGDTGSLLDPAQANQGARLEASTQPEPQKLWPYPPIPPETLDLVKRALAEAIDRGMTESDVKRHVAEILAGNPPEVTSVKNPRAVKPTQEPGQTAVHPVVKAVLGHIQNLAETTTQTQGPNKGGEKGPKPSKNPNKGPAKGTGAKPLWLMFLKWAWKNLSRGFFWLVYLPIRMLKKGLTQCLEGHWVNGLIQLGLTLLVCWGILWVWHHPARVIGEVEGFVVRCYHSAVDGSDSKPAQEVAASKPVEAPPQAIPTAVVAQASRPQAEMRDFVVPGQKIKGPGASPLPPAKPKHPARAKAPIKKGVSPTQNLALKTQNSQAPVVSPPPSSAPVNGKVSDTDFVLKFATALYSIGYQNYQTQETTLLNWVTKDCAGDLKGHYFNPYILKNMVSIHRTKTFTTDGPVKWVSSNETTVEFMVSGTIAGQGEWNGQPSNSVKHVKARFDIIHDTQGKALVNKISEEMTE